MSALALSPDGEALAPQPALRLAPPPAGVSVDDWLGLLIARADPAGWVRDHLGATLSPNGVAIAEAVRDFPRVAVKAAHAISKSYSAARLVIWWLHAYPGTVVLTTAPTFRQVREILWREIAAAYDASRQPLQGRLLAGTQIQIGPKWYALGFKAADREGSRFQGYHAPFLLVVLDEANGVSRTVVESLLSTLSSGHTRLLMIGNPVEPAGEFYDAFTTKADLYKTITVSAFDTPNFTEHDITSIEQVLAMSPADLARAETYPYLTTPRWVQEVVREFGADSPYVASRVLATFPEATPDALIPLGWVERARQREDLVATAADPVEAGLDIAGAGSGADETVLAVRQGPQTLAEHAWTGIDTMATVGKVAALLAPYGPALKAIRVDIIGIGDGPFHRLRELGFPVVPVDVRNAPSGNKEYPNRRAELWWGLRERFQAGTINAAALSEKTVGQLTSIRAVWKSGYRYADVEKKDDVKRRGLRSPDRGEAWLFAFAGGLGYGDLDPERHLATPAEGSALGGVLLDPTTPRW